jgi:hypothetical protein
MGGKLYDHIAALDLFGLRVFTLWPFSGCVLAEHVHADGQLVLGGLAVAIELDVDRHGFHQLGNCAGNVLFGSNVSEITAFAAFNAACENRNASAELLVSAALVIMLSICFFSSVIGF